MYQGLEVWVLSPCCCCCSCGVWTCSGGGGGQCIDMLLLLWCGDSEWWRSMVNGEHGCNKTVSINSNVMKKWRKHTWGSRCIASWALAALLDMFLWLLACWGWWWWWSHQGWCIKGDDGGDGGGSGNRDGHIKGSGGDRSGYGDGFIDGGDGDGDGSGELGDMAMLKSIKMCMTMQTSANGPCLYCSTFKCLTFPSFHPCLFHI